jgi:hypothetical protein
MDEVYGQAILLREKLEICENGTPRTSRKLRRGYESG